MVSTFRHARALLTFPFTVTVVIPALLILYSPVLPFELPGTVGLFLYFFGVSILLYTNILFHNYGDGTLAPFDPPKKFVATGIYLHVRNPMIGGVILMLIGEFIYFKSLGLGIFCGFFFIMNNIYFKFHEEPELLKRFGSSYKE
jgi:protein-S-isoprenylcysteine O-methyltransferase Ste14